MDAQYHSGGSHVVDLYFHVQGKEITVDHGYALYGAISRCLESERDRWLHGSEEVGLIPVRGRYLGQGRLALGRNARFGRWTVVPRRTLSALPSAAGTSSMKKRFAEYP